MSKNIQLIQIVSHKLGQQLDLSIDSLKEAPQLFEAAKYMLLEGQGKRIRPKIAALTFCALNSDKPYEMIIPVAVALEHLHVASLIHDDLPAIDNDDYRRGRLSCHKMFSEASAVLVADAMITLAFEQISQSAFSDSIKSKLIARFSKAWTQLCVGQSLDLTESANWEALTIVHQRKTGALMSCAFAAGAECADQELNLVKLFEAYGQHAGVIFQLQDDLLDHNSADQKGRPESSDARNTRPAHILALSDPKTGAELLRKYRSEAQNIFNEIERISKKSFEDLKFFVDETFFSKHAQEKDVLQSSKEMMV